MSSMNTIRVLALMACAGLAACVHYEPKPVPIGRFTDAYDSRQLNEHPPGAVWSDADLLQGAIARSPAAAEAASNYRSLLAAAKASRAPPPISLLLVAEYSRDAGGTSPWLFSGLLNIPLDYGTKRSARLNAADLAAMQGLYDYSEALWTVRSAVVHAHIQRAAAEREAILAQQIVQLRQDRANKLQNRIRSGEDARAAGITAETELAAAQHRVQDLLNLRSQADEALAKALGAPFPAIQALGLAPLPDAIPTVQTDALRQWRQDATLKRADVLRAVIDYNIAEENLRLEVAKQYPDVQIGPGYTFERGEHKIPFDLTLILPPADLNKANIQAAEAKRALAAAKLDGMQAMVLTAVDLGTTALIGDQASLNRSLNQDLPLARRAAQAASKALAAGELDRLDEEFARAAALEAELAVLEAWRTTWLAVADLEDALHRPSPAEAAILDAAVKRIGDKAS